MVRFVNLTDRSSSKPENVSDCVRAKNSPVPVRGFFEWLRTGDLFGLRTPIILLIVVTVGASIVLRYTRFGRQIYATGSSEEVAYLAGLPTARVKIFAYMISSVLAAVGGLVLMARIGSGDPRSGGGLELRAIAAVVLAQDQTPLTVKTVHNPTSDSHRGSGIRDPGHLGSYVVVCCSLS